MQTTSTSSRYFALKRIMITGASSGIGRACAFWFLNQGARVALVGRDKSALDAIGEHFPHQAVTAQCDFVSDMSQYELVTGVVEALGGLDILINAAGLIFENDLEGTFPQDHDYLLDINLRAVFHISSMCAPFLKRSKGVILNFSAEWGNRPQQGIISYCMTKAGIEMLTKCLALELAPVRVNAVAPGVTRTNLMNYLLVPQEDQDWVYRRIADTTPLKRVANVDDIAKIVVFLCSNKARKITGQVLRCDGGRHLTNALFTHWDSSGTMSSKIFPKQNQQVIGREVSRTSNQRLNLREMLEKSRWYTDMADAHVKIRSGYNAREVEEDDVFVGED
jgi:NAD(P)-dependent dehydrogenase (short-subunit alcohol dehydrogenase family)